MMKRRSLESLLPPQTTVKGFSGIWKEVRRVHNLGYAKHHSRKGSLTARDAWYAQEIADSFVFGAVSCRL